MFTANKVLVIDDDPLVLKTIGAVLKKQGYEYQLAEDAQVALEYTNQVDFDVILADIRMPVVNGVDAVKQIQKARKEMNKPEIPIIFITGFAEEGIRLKADLVGEVIQKPFDLDHLMITMREYL